MSLLLVEIDCALSEERCEAMLSALPESVVARAKRYRFAQPRYNLVASQTALRQCLAAVGIDPNGLAVCGRGRPYLLGRELEFNLSHSHQRAVLILSTHGATREALGVDLEWMRRRIDRTALARRFFTADESDYCEGGAEPFFRVWTRKEAILKTNGVGLRVALDSFDVLSDQVEQKITGMSLELGTRVTEDGYVISWAAGSGCPTEPSATVEAFSQGWLERVREGIAG